MGGSAYDPEMPSKNARYLRKNQTEAEKRLWWSLRRKQLRGARFRRQAPIGPYIVDFFCPEAKLIIELDGGQHADAVAADTRRTAWLEARSYRVVRFWNNDVMENIDGVLEVIATHLDATV